MTSYRVMDDFFDNWTIQVRKGLLEFAILTSMEEGEHYGYALVKRICSVPGLFVAEGSMYPLLSRLRAAELITYRLEESRDGPARKYYALTPLGRAELAKMQIYYTGLNTALGSLKTTG
jgi:PadR family transcriptional regulator, regulatory protein PadR